MKKILKKITPSFLFSFYRFCRAYLAAIMYGLPSRDLIIIGVTGTKGKSMTANFIWAGLRGAGIEAGLISTANMRLGEEEFLNPYHMTMPDPFQMQKMLRKIKKCGLKIAIVESTSEGIAQFRHKGIVFDVLVFTNLTPEHILSHGTFENYRTAKQMIFKELGCSKKKRFGGKIFPKVIIANSDSSESKYFLSFDADKKITFGLNPRAEYAAENIREKEEGISFDFRGREINLNIHGSFSVLNALPAVIVGDILHAPIEAIISGLGELKVIPGRMEIIEKKPFFVIVDYAHEKESLMALLKAARLLSSGRIILLLGAEGGGRDKNKRALMGKIGSELADFMVISNVDPYDDDPIGIINDIANAAVSDRKKIDESIFLIEDRRMGIKKAISLATAGDIVLITGKGSEQSMIIQGKKIPWDDRLITKEVLLEYNKKDE